MTKKEYANQIVQIIQNANDKLDEEIIEDVETFLDVLEPRHRQSFAKWGYPDVQVGLLECWD